MYSAYRGKLWTDCNFQLSTVLEYVTLKLTCLTISSFVRSDIGGRQQDYLRLVKDSLRLPVLMRGIWSKQRSYLRLVEDSLCLTVSVRGVWNREWTTELSEARRRFA